MPLKNIKSLLKFKFHYGLNIKLNKNNATMQAVKHFDLFPAIDFFSFSF